MIAEVIAVLPADEFADAWWAADDMHGDRAIEVFTKAVHERAIPAANATTSAGVFAARLLVLFTALLVITWRVTRRPLFSGLFQQPPTVEEQNAVA